MNPPESTAPVPPRKIARAFSAHAADYESHADIQRELARAVVESLSGLTFGKRPWIDLGCGPGLVCRMLHNRGILHQAVCMDIAPGSLDLLRLTGPGGTMPVRGDIRAVPLRSGQCEVALLVSVLQWVRSARDALSEAFRVLGDHGRLAYAVFLEPSYGELRTLRRRRGLADPGMYYTEAALEERIRECGFSIERSRRVHGTRYYAGPLNAVKSLVRTGSCATPGDSLPARDLFALCREYKHEYGTPRGIPLSYNAAVGVAIKRG